MVLKIVYVQHSMRSAQVGRVTITRKPRPPSEVDEIVDNADYGDADFDPIKRAQAMTRLYMTLLKKD